MSSNLHQRIFPPLYPEKHTATSFIKKVLGKNPYLLPDLAPNDYTILKTLVHHHFAYFQIVEGEFRQSKGWNFGDFLRYETKRGGVENVRLVEIYQQLKEQGIWIANQSVYKFHQHVTFNPKEKVTLDEGDRPSWDEVVGCK